MLSESSQKDFNVFKCNKVPNFSKQLCGLEAQRDIHSQKKKKKKFVKGVNSDWKSLNFSGTNEHQCFPSFSEKINPIPYFCFAVSSIIYSQENDLPENYQYRFEIEIFFTFIY